MSGDRMEEPRRTVAMERAVGVSPGVNVAELCARANQIAQESAKEHPDRRRAPVLSSQSDREDICEWLQWCDPNGCHTDELYQREYGYEPVPCETCHGSGDSPDFDERRPCRECDGDGKIPDSDPEALSYRDTPGAWRALKLFLDEEDGVELVS